MEFIEFKNIHEMLKQTVDAVPNKNAYSWLTENGGREYINWGEFYKQVRTVSKGLMALGVEKGDKVNIISYSCFKWVLSDMGITTCGGVTVGIYQSNLAKDCQYIINHSEAVVIFAEDVVQLKKLLEVKDQIPNVKKVILFNGSHDDDWVMTYEEFMALGENESEETLDKIIADTTPEDLAAIVYTSGTTGVPKGGVLTHDNIAFTSQSVKGCTTIEDSDETFLFLPLAHIFARTSVYSAMLAASPLTFASSIENVVNDMAIAKPHWFASVPRIYEKVYGKVLAGAESKGGAALKIFRWSMGVGEQVVDFRLAKKPIPFMLGLKYALATKLVFSKVQAALGGRVRWCISGAAPINATVERFFHAAGIIVVEGLGMTENTSFSHLNRYDNYRIGAVGQPGPGVEQKIAEDGEVMIRGRNVMKEYYKMPEETAKNITKDGWLLTGDIGEIDSEGFLKITDRKKDLIITAGGKNVAPSAIEGVLGTSKYINQVCVVGDKRKFLSALITLEADPIMEYAHDQNIQYKDLNDLLREEKITQLIEKEVAVLNKEFASFESVKQISIVPEFTIENSLMTPSMKLKKNIIMKTYGETIDEMYPKD